MLSKMPCVDGIIQPDRLSNSHLNHLNVRHEKITAFGLEIHKVQVELLKKQSNLDDLYQKFNIFLPQNIKNTRLIRQLEFFTGRLAAKYALHTFNLQDSIVYQGEHGEPIWPDDVIGSISHVGTQKLCKAIAYAKNKELDDKTFGIDIESQEHHIFFQQDDEFYDVFLHKSEQEGVAKAKIKQPDLDLILFSAKESMIKVFYIKYHQIIDFKSIIFLNIENSFIYFNIQQVNLLKQSIAVKVHFLYKDNEIITISCI